MPEQQLLDMAAEDIDAFEEFQKQLIYLDQRGNHMSRSEFKSGIRVSAKNLNFGIPYGRGARDIARQVKGETGSQESLESLERDIEKMMGTWKNKTYADAWKFMQQCADAVNNPGYLANPWGRVRRFPATNKGDLIASMQREAQNYPIQSTVADTCAIAMYLMVEYRKKHGLHFLINNQIHDAIMVQAPEVEIEATKQMFADTMGNINIPIQNGDALRLGIDIDVLDRWGVKRK
jgi:DNA polymerase I-like protein with 3'-5' exonuclease and polymerase domains